MSADRQQAILGKGSSFFVCQASLQWKTAWRLIYSPRMQLRLVAQHHVLMHLPIFPGTAIRGLNGVSLKTFFRRMQGEGPTLLLLQDLGLFCRIEGSGEGKRTKTAGHRA